MDNNIPVARRQLVHMALVMLGPLVLSIAAICWAPAKPGQTPSDSVVAFAIVGAVGLLLVALLAAAATRHTIAITPAAITVRHSVYTLQLHRGAVMSASVREIGSIGEAGLSTRKNGTAFSGYYSGWFWNLRGGLVFCAASARPLYLVTFEGHAQCRQLVLSASPEVARAIAAWAAG